MENIAVIAAITLVAAGIAYILGGPRTALRRTRRTSIAAISAGVAASVAVCGIEALVGEDSELIDKTVAEARTLPLVGLILDDVPDAEKRLRTSLREELRNPTTQGPPRPLLLMAELRSTHIVPALRATDVAEARAVLDTRIALMRHLRGADVALCRELALVGLHQPDKLDPAGQKLMRDMLASMEKAYRAGRLALQRGAAPSSPSDAEAATLLSEAGLTADDFDRLRNLARQSADEACDLGIKLNEASRNLPAHKAALLARHLAAAQ
ncbi:MAG: hypothetical protein IBJ17_17435 [Reyranella sp.]|nr:hypothetical protein [Reyranella sp.]